MADKGMRAWVAEAAGKFGLGSILALRQEIALLRAELAVVNARLAALEAQPPAKPLPFFDSF